VDYDTVAEALMTKGCWSNETTVITPAAPGYPLYEDVLSGKVAAGDAATFRDAEFAEAARLGIDEYELRARREAERRAAEAASLGLTVAELEARDKAKREAEAEDELAFFKKITARREPHPTTLHSH